MFKLPHTCNHRGKRKEENIIGPLNQIDDKMLVFLHLIYTVWCSSTIALKENTHP